jgi:carbamoyl-phosphate synthase large subunit
MAKIMIGGAGGAPSEGVIYSLMRSNSHHIIGVGSDPSDLILSQAGEKYLVPQANHPDYEDRLLSLIAKVRPDLVHFQNDAEIFVASQLREKIQALGTRVFMPEHPVIDTCVHKHLSYLAFKRAGVVVPLNQMLLHPRDLERAFETLRVGSDPIWFRSTAIGGGGAGSLSTSSFELARSWIDHHKGWGKFSAAEHLTGRTVTWTSIWFEGKLHVAQTRRRQGWVHGNRSVSGVTGVTKIGVTDSDPKVDAVAMEAVLAVSQVPHGIFSVDMCYDNNDVPNPTEINISRFFTTIRFFTEAGLNLPGIFVDLALSGSSEVLGEKLNPLPKGLGWFRGMDREPLLMRVSDFESKFVGK